MNSSLLTARNILVQGITGSHGSFQTAAMLAAGTNIVAGVTPGKGGERVHSVPVFNSIKDAQKTHSIDSTVIFVPARFAKAAILEAIAANIPLIVCITEGIPVHDMLEVRQKLLRSNSVLIGPNSPGVLLPGIQKLGIIPAHFGLPGSTAIVSRSGTLTYETMAGLTNESVGQKYIIGIGGDTIHGIGYIEALQLFENDPDVEKVVLIGEIGGQAEIQAADYINKHVTKPVFAYIAGHYAPEGVQLGHAGAILGSKQESAKAKTTYLKEKGIHTSDSTSELITAVTQG